MKRLFALGLAACIMLVALLLTGSQQLDEQATGEIRATVQDRNPWTHLRTPRPVETFHFAVVSDRTGGARPQVFARAIDQLNLLRPAFVLSVGDLIEGYSEDRAELTRQWREFEACVGKLTMPFFYVPGNHDLSNSVQEEQWRERFGRRYYHFVYRNVLFLALNADDPPARGGGLGPFQIAFADKTLRDNPNVDWTVVLLHRPLWDEEPRGNGWAEIEDSLQGRRFTVFAGHVHAYRKSIRRGMSYYQLATTGGGSRLRGPRHGEFDHIVWVTMSKEGPTVANILVDGVLPDDVVMVRDGS